MKLHVKSDSEIATLQAKLDELKTQQAQKAQKATQAQQAQIADVENQLQQAQRAQWDAREATHAAEQAGALTDYNETLGAIVECAGELRGLLAALDERRKQAQAVGVPFLPQHYTAALTNAIANTFVAWDANTDLTGKAAERETSERKALRNAEAQLAHTQKLWADAKARVENYKGSRGDQLAIELMKRVDALTSSLFAQRHHVTQALLALGDQMTMQDRQRALELQEAVKGTVVLSW